MQEFSIRLRSFSDVQDFIRISTAQPFHVRIGNDHQTTNATSYMGLMSLDLNHKLLVSCDCSDSEFTEFRRQSACFLAE